MPRFSSTRRVFPAVISAAWLCMLASGRAETLTLEDCLRETAAHSPLIVAQQLEVERATATRLVLRARALPTLQVGGILGYQGAETSEVEKVTVRDLSGHKQTVSVTTERPATFVLLGTGMLSQPIFDVSIPPSWRRGTTGILVAQENYYTIAATQLYRARTQFYRALFQQQSGGLYRQVDEILAGNVQAQTSLASAGLRGRQNVLASQVQRANFDPVIVAATGSYRSTLAGLLQIMGREPGTGANGDDPVAHITLGGTLEDAAFDFDAAAAARESLEHRPDLRALRAQMQATKEDAAIIRGGYYPRIRVYVAGEILPENFVRSTQPNAVRSSDQVQTSEIRPGVRGDWTVIDTGAIQGEARRLDAVRAELEVNVQRLEKDIPGELAAVRAAIHGSAVSLDALRGNVTTAQDTLNIINAGITQGINSQLEFLDAQNGVLATRAGLLAAELDLSLARAEFDRITGRYLHFVTDDASAATPTRSNRK